MIGHLKGKIIDIGLSKVVVDAGGNGVGYIVHSTASTLEKKHIGGEISLWIHTAVRETDISLYGFEKQEELIMFEKLLSVSGIGPKSALAIISIAGIKSIEDAVITGNTSILTNIGGVGKKTADKIVLELSGKIASSTMSASTQDDLDVFEALKALGYRENMIQDVLKDMPKDVEGANNKIKHVLKILSIKK
jgi:holliday junction DNA helicase RuvA